MPAASPRVMSRRDALAMIEMGRGDPAVMAALADPGHPAYTKLLEWKKRLEYWAYEHPQDSYGNPVIPTAPEDPLARLDNLTPEAARARLAAVEASAEFRQILADGSHPKHAFAMEGLERLQRRAHPDEFPSEPDPAALDRLDWFQTGILLFPKEHPYNDVAHPEHAAAVAAMRELVAATDPAAPAAERPTDLPADLAGLTPAQAAREHRKMLSETFAAQAKGESHPGHDPWHPGHKDYTARGRQLLSIMETDPAGLDGGGFPDVAGMTRDQALAAHGKILSETHAAFLKGESHPGWDRTHIGFKDFQANAKSLLNAIGSAAPDGSPVAAATTAGPSDHP